MSDPGWKFPFGKHSGTPIGKIPADYLRYLLGWDKLRPTTKVRIEAELNRRGNPDTPEDDEEARAEDAARAREGRRRLSLDAGRLAWEILDEGYKTVCSKCPADQIRIAQTVYDVLGGYVTTVSGARNPREVH